MFWRAILVTTAIVLAASPVGVHAAGAACLRADLAAFDAWEARGPLEGHAGWTRVVGFSAERLPMVPTLLAVRGDVTCDLTHGLAAFLGPAASPRDDAEALAVAKLAVGAIYVDVLPDVSVLPGALVARLADGYEVSLPVWTPRNGVVADAAVRLDGEVAASFVVRERAVGKFTPAIEGWNLRPGDTERLLAGDVDALATKILTGANADGTSWRVTYFTQNYVNESEADRHAQMHLDGAIASYANGTAWGFVSRDPDGILSLTLDGCDCIYREPNANIHMFPRANDILPLVPGLAFRSEEETAELIVGHELFHHFQYGIMQWRHGAWLVEGMARFTETANVPDFAFIPTSLTYYSNSNGMNGFMNNPSGGIHQHSYDWSIVWGWLYAHEGGMPLLKAVLEESATGGIIANTDGVAAIQRAMDRVPGGTHATFAESYLAFTKALLTREGFVWGAPDGSQVHDWATYLDPVGRHNSLGGPYLAQPWSISVHNGRSTTPAGASVIAYTGHPQVTSLAASKTGGTFSFRDALPVNAFAGVEDAALVTVRLGVGAQGDPAGAGAPYAVTTAR